MNPARRSVLGLVAATASARGMGIVSGLLVARWLGPASMGVWSTLRAAISYGNINHLGALEAYRSQWVRLRGAQEESAAWRLEAQAHGTARVTSWSLALGASLVLSFLAWLDPLSLLARNLWAALAVAWTCVPVTMGTFWSEALAVRQLFAELAKLRLWRGCTYALAIPTGVVLHGVCGAAVALLLSEVMLSWLTRRQALIAGASADVIYDGRAARALIAVGLPITVGWWSITLVESVDRVMCTAVLGEHQAGLYSIGILLASLVFLAPEALSRVTGCHWNFRAGRDGPSSVERQCGADSMRVAMVVAPFAAVASFWVPWLLSSLLPSYSEGAHSASLLLAASSLTALVPASIDRLVATGRSARLLWIAPLALLLRCLLAWLGLEWGTLGALATSSAVATTGFVVLLWSDRVGRSVVPWLLAGPLLALTCRGAVLQVLPNDPSMQRAAVQSLLFICGYLGFAWLIHRLELRSQSTGVPNTHSSA